MPPNSAAHPSRLSIFLDLCRGAAIIVGCFYAGLGLKAGLGLIIPANVLGLFILLTLLGIKLVPLEWVQLASKWLLFFLPMLFVPIYVGAAADKALWAQWGWLLLTVMVTAVAAMWLLVGHLAQRIFPKA